MCLDPQAFLTAGPAPSPRRAQEGGKRHLDKIPLMRKGTAQLHHHHGHIRLFSHKGLYPVCSQGAPAALLTHQ